MTMVRIILDADEVGKLAKKLRDMNHIRFDAVVKKNAVQIFNRAKTPGGTPVSTEDTRPGGPHGELRQSVSMYGDEVGYTKEYAAHVEYGHRTRNGGFVLGQRFLKKNVEQQRLTFYRDLLKAIRKG